MNPCECISHEVAVRRLLNFLRQSQSYCTDTACMDEIDNSGAADNFILTALVIGFALLMYMMRPRSNRPVENAKTIENNQGPLPPPDAPTN